jgi:hypothetical protein
VSGSRTIGDEGVLDLSIGIDKRPLVVSEPNTLDGGFLLESRPGNKSSSSNV